MDPAAFFMAGRNRGLTFGSSAESITKILSEPPLCDFLHGACRDCPAACSYVLRSPRSGPDIRYGIRPRFFGSGHRTATRSLRRRHATSTCSRIYADIPCNLLETASEEPLHICSSLHSLRLVHRRFYPFPLASGRLGTIAAPQTEQYKAGRCGSKLPGR